MLFEKHIIILKTLHILKIEFIDKTLSLFFTNNITSIWLSYLTYNFKQKNNQKIQNSDNKLIGSLMSSVFGKIPATKPLRNYARAISPSKTQFLMLQSHIEVVMVSTQVWHSTWQHHLNLQLHSLLTIRVVLLGK